MAGTGTGAIRVAGLRRLRRDLRALQGDLEGPKAANAKVAALVAGAAAARSPRRSGQLAGSGRGNNAATRATVTFGGARVPYAGPIHYGWPAHGIEPHPFVTDAAIETEPQWLPLYEAEIAAALAPLEGQTY